VKAHQREGCEAFLLSFEQRFQALKCFQKLAPYNVPLMSAVDAYIAEHCVTVAGKTVSDGVDDFVKSCRRANLKPRTITQYESDLSIYCETFAESQMTGVVRDDVEEWLDEFDWSARTRRNKLTTLTTFYTFAIDKNYCAINPAERIKRPKVDDEPIGLLTPDQTEALLNQAIKDRKDLVGSIAIAAFAGPRRSELCALNWEEIHRQEREAEVKASKAKTRQRRIISINATLAKWLEVYGLDKGPVSVTHNADVWGKWVRELAQSAGIEVWPKNALRHGFGSYFFALIKDEARVAAEMGNSPEMVHRHYRAIVTGDNCSRFWAILPPQPKQSQVTTGKNHE
jgi:integrase